MATTAEASFACTCIFPDQQTDRVNKRVLFSNEKRHTNLHSKHETPASKAMNPETVLAMHLYKHLQNSVVSWYTLIVYGRLADSSGPCLPAC